MRPISEWGDDKQYIQYEMSGFGERSRSIGME